MRKAELDDIDGVDDTCTDHSLLRRFRTGEQEAATQLYLRYAGRLQALASAQTAPALTSRFDPEDVVQSVFRTFFRRVSEGLYDVPPGEELWQLLLVLALNKVRKLATHHRAQRRDVSKTCGGELLDYQMNGRGDQNSLQILQIVIEDLLCQLSPSQRAMVELRIEGTRVEEIAQQTERSKRTVERVLQDFRRKLSQLIDVKPDPN